MDSSWTHEFDYKGRHVVLQIYSAPRLLRFVDGHAFYDVTVDESKIAERVPACTGIGEQWNELILQGRVERFMDSGSSEALL